jgi:predicted ATP-grasp superfamily ATP-dependent carboligase
MVIEPDGSPAGVLRKPCANLKALKIRYFSVLPTWKCALSRRPDKRLCSAQNLSVVPPKK